MLLVYICLVGTLIAAFVAGAVLAKNQNLVATLEKPFYETLRRYDPRAASQEDQAITKAWDGIQKDVSEKNVLVMKICCGSLISSILLSNGKLVF